MGDLAAEQPDHIVVQRLGLRYAVRSGIDEARCLLHVTAADPWVRALQLELPPLLVEREDAETRHKRVRTTGTILVVRRRPRSADEAHPRHQRAWRMLLAKQDHARSEVVEIRRAARPRKPDRKRAT